MLFKFEITAGLAGVAMASTDGSVVTVHLALDAKGVEPQPTYKIMFSEHDWISVREKEVICEDGVRIAIAHFAESFMKPESLLHFTATAEMGRWPGRFVKG